MKLLAEISDQHLGLGSSEQLGKDYTLRKSARGIVLNSKGEMACQYLSNCGYHKLPGGGVDPGEKIEEALRREIIEEVGCKIKDIELVGVTIEYRNKYNLLHVSFGYKCSIDGDINLPALEEKEIAEGHETVWMMPDLALEKMKNDLPNDYDGKFISLREKTILSEFIKKVLI